eukprot:scaffold75_cov376-Prasinococcus_capsulatus_cf.AAC.3
MYDKGQLLAFGGIACERVLLVEVFWHGLMRCAVVSAIRQQTHATLWINQFVGLLCCIQAILRRLCIIFLLYESVVRGWPPLCLVVSTGCLTAPTCSYSLPSNSICH